MTEGPVSRTGYLYLEHPTHSNWNNL